VRPNFCLSDVNGETCSPDFINFIKNDLAKDYKNVSINSPYFGGHVTRYLNKKHKSLNNIQIEISRTLYMNEENKELKENSDLKKNLTRSLINLFNQF
jgi:N-formylglutamate deformylase